MNGKGSSYTSKIFKYIRVSEISLNEIAVFVCMFSWLEVRVRVSSGFTWELQC